MPTIRKTAAGTYETNVYVGKDENGKRRYKHLTCPTRSEILTLLREIEGNRGRGAIVTHPGTLGDFVHDYIGKRDLRKGDSALSPSTIDKYYAYLNSSLYKDLAPYKLDKLTDEIIQRAIDRFAEDHSPKSVSLRWGLIKAAVKEADPSFDPHVTLPRIKRKRLEMPEKDKLQQLFGEIRGHGMEIPVLLGAVCGLRRSEISPLDLTSDVDYEKGTIRISKGMVLAHSKKYVTKVPKTDAAFRVVQVPAWVLERLAEARDNPNYKMYTPNSITTGWHRLAVKHGISCSFHGLRHYFASVMESLHVPEAYQMERMGHTTTYMLRRYQEYLRETETDINSAMDSYFSSIAPSVDATKNATNPNMNEEKKRKQAK